MKAPRKPHGNEEAYFQEQERKLIEKLRAEREQLAGAAEFQASLHNLKVDVFGEVAVATLEPEFLVRTGEATFQGKDRSTFVLVKTDQGWKIAHEHHSPFRQNSRTP